VEAAVSAPRGLEGVEVLVLASGSSGNAVLVRSAGDAVLVDAGISRLAIRRRLEAAGCSVGEVRALLVTHEHSDHVGGIPVLMKRHPMPLWATAGTWSRLDVRAPGGGELRSGRAVRFGKLEILPVATSHDAAEPVAFVVDDGVVRVGICTDTGVITPLLAERLSALDLLLLEANHDADMLRHGPYPWPLKQRIASRHGHLANHQAQEALGRLVTPELRGVVAMHLSETNNLPALAEECFAGVVDGAIPVGVAGRDHILRILLESASLRMERLDAPPSRVRRRGPGPRR